MGSNLKKIVYSKHNSHPCFGKGTGYKRGELERLFRSLTVLGVLEERLIVNAKGFTMSYTQIGRKARQFAGSKDPLWFAFAQESTDDSIKLLSTSKKRRHSDDEYAQRTRHYDKQSHQENKRMSKGDTVKGGGVSSKSKYFLDS